MNSMTPRNVNVRGNTGTSSVPIAVTPEGEIKTAPQSQSAYGDAYSTELIPKIAGSAVYGFLPANFRTFTATSGAAGVVANMFECSTGTTQYAYGTIQSFRTLNYKIGQGALVRFGACFPSTPTASTWIAAGMFNIGDEVSFGYNGVDFGTFHRHGGRAEIQHLQVTTVAGGAETASVTIDGTLYSIPITATTVQTNAFEISEYLDANATGWEFEQLDDTVIMVATSDGDKTGTFSFSSTGTAIASYTEVTVGVTKTTDFTSQSAWNGETIEDLNVGFGNNFQIMFKDGFGNIDYCVEHPTKGGFVTVHTVYWGNLNTTANLHNPSLRAGCYAASVGATTDVSVQMTDISAFILGSDKPTRNPRAADATNTIGTSLLNLLTLRNAREYNGHVNQVEMRPIELTVANDGNKAAIFEIRTNPTVGGITNFQAVGTNLVSEVDVSGTTVSGGRLIAAYAVARLSSLVVHLDDLEIALPPTIRFVIAAKMVSGTSAELSASIVYYEDL